MASAIVSALHVLALAIGLPAVFVRGRAFFVLNHVQMALVVVIVFVASFMARGFGLR